MIVFVPSKPSSQLSLLELLMKSAARTQGKSSNKKIKKLQKVHEVQNLQERLSDQQPFEYLQHKQNSPLYHSIPQTFVESRSPYKVDIDSTLGHESQYMEILPSTFQGYTRQSPVLQLLKNMPHQGNYNKGYRNYRSIDDSLYGFSGGEGVENTDLDEDDLNNTDVNEFNSLNTHDTEGISDIGHISDIDGGFKLLGAVEQCGPDRLRDSYGICQFVRQ